MLDERDIVAVKSAVLFATLPESLADRVLSQAGIRTFSRGETLFLQDDPAEAVFVVLDGWVKLFRMTQNGAEAVVGTFTRGQSFGEAVVFQRSAYPVSAEAVTDCRLLQVRAETILTMMRDQPEIAMAMVASTFRHLHDLVGQIEQLKAHSGAQRIAEFLLSLCACETGACTVTLPYDKSLIAGRLGMKPESLSRAFSRLKSVGVAVHQNQATISDVAALRVYANEDRAVAWSQAQ